jgi:beta-1,4-mannosyltransferase
MNNKELYCYPLVFDTNEYIKCQARVWASLGFTVKAAPTNVLGSLNLISFKRKDYIVLNWFEDRVNYSRIHFTGFIRSVVMLWIFRLIFRKVYWVRHNVKGHDEGGAFLRSVLEEMLGRIADAKIVHRPCEGYRYIPHPLYDRKVDIPSLRDIPYLYFGAVKRYKGLTELLSVWPTHVQLVMAGKSYSDDLTAEIEQIIRSRNLNVIWHNRFLSSPELDQLVARSSFVILSHMEKSMIVSGAAYHSFTYGANLLVRAGEFGKYLEKNFTGVFTFSLSEIATTIQQCKPVPYGEVMSRAHEVCGDEVIGSQWRSLLNTVSHA